MDAWEKGRKVALWGTGKNGKRHYYKLRERYEIIAFIDNKPGQQEMFGLPVIKPEEIDISAYSIVICSTSCEEIAKQCCEMGYYLYEHFLPYYMVCYHEIKIYEIWKYARSEKVKEIICNLAQDKKVAYIHGNCQIDVIKRYFQHAFEFQQRYVFLSIPPVHMNREIDLLMENISTLSVVKLFLTQCISRDNGFDDRFETEYMIALLKKHTENMQVIKIPNLFFDLYFPQGGRMPNRKNVLVQELGAGVFPYSDLFLDDLSRRFSWEQIWTIVSDTELFSSEDIKKYVEYRFLNLEEREKECDITMVDFVKERYQKEQLFYSRNHPVNKVMRELVVRVLRYMHIPNSDCFEQEESIPQLNQWQEFIYPSVAKGLGLEFEKYKYSDGDSTEEWTLKQEVERYLSYCCRE